MILTEAQVQNYIAMVSNGKLSLDTFWAVLKAGGILPETFDPEEEKSKLDADGLTVDPNREPQAKPDGAKPDMEEMEPMKEAA